MLQVRELSGDLREPGNRIARRCPGLAFTEFHMASQPPTSSQLRHDIDSGRTGEKVAFPDPAAAPLGTDDEAAGTPPSGEAVAAAHRAEVKDPVTARHEAKPDPGTLIFVVAVAVFALAVIAAGLLAL
jgi:hypothetical protein